MRIIEFLLDNIFIVVIVFGALASMLRKSGSRRGPARMPDFGGEGNPGIPSPSASDRERIEEQQRERSNAQTVYRTRSEQTAERISPSASASHGYREGNPNAAAAKRTLQSAATFKPQTAAMSEANNIESNKFAASLQAEDLRKAVVWSEILGQPRSKNPYRK